jgi:hypothetical protein
MFANLPSDVPVLGGLPIWFSFVCIATALLLGTLLNNFYFAWLHRNWPGLFKPRNLLAIVALCIAVIAVGMWINPPSKVREEFYRAHPELVSKPAK